MESVLINRSAVFKKRRKNDSISGVVKNLAQAQVDREYEIKGIATEDQELKSFLFTLGCYEGERVALISILAENYVINVKDARYGIDKELAEAILI